MQNVLELSKEIDSLQRERVDDHVKFQQELLKFADAERRARVAKYKLGMQVVDILKSRGVDIGVVQVCIIFGLCQPSNHLTIQPSIHPTIHPSNHPTIQFILSHIKYDLLQLSYLCRAVKIQEVQMVVASTTSSSVLSPRPYELLDPEMSSQGPGPGQGQGLAANRIGAPAAYPAPADTLFRYTADDPSRGIAYNNCEPAGMGMGIVPGPGGGTRLDAEALRHLDYTEPPRSKPLASVRSGRSGGLRSVRSGRRVKKDVLDRDESDSIISSVSTHRSGRPQKVPRSKGSRNPRHATITAENLAILNRLNGDRSGPGMDEEGDNNMGNYKYDREPSRQQVQRTKQSDQIVTSGMASWWPNLFV
jgi:hypothetical protein